MFVFTFAIANPALQMGPWPVVFTDILLAHSSSGLMNLEFFGVQWPDFNREGISSQYSLEAPH